MEIKFTTGDIIAILVAMIALIGVLISTIYTNQTTKKISESNEKLQVALNQKNIDANLVANARIEWIQNVRRTTSELIPQYFLIIDTVDKNILTEALLGSRAKTELLILYFGPDNKREEDVDLYNEEDNLGKNKEIVEFLTKLSRKVDSFYKYAMSEELIRLKEARRRRLEELPDHVRDWEHEEVEINPGEVVLNSTPILDEEYDNSINEIEGEIEYLKELTEDIQQDIAKLRNIIRIYLKVEWKVAKLGE